MKRLRRVTIGCFILAAVLFAPVFTHQAMAVLSYSGDLTYPTGIVAAGGWQSASTTFAWEVTEVGSQGGLILWQYDYTLTVPTKNISHFLIEVSPGAVLSDFTFLNTNLGVIGTYSGEAGGSNPNMPDTMYGLKFAGADIVATASFTTTRSPVWGDFYAKDGQDGGTWVTAWNTGFLADDPTADPTNGSLDGHILRPDTDTTVVPLPAAVWLLGTGLIGLVGVRRRMKKI